MVYSAQDYDTLFNNEKLIYFKFKPKSEKRKKITVTSACYQPFIIVTLLMKSHLKIIDS
jgi:hypothetical protein